MMKGFSWNYFQPGQWQATLVSFLDESPRDYSNFVKVTYDFNIELSNS